MPLINTAYSFNVALASQLNPNLFQSSPTLATGDVKVSVDDAAFANITTLPVVSPAASKLVKVSLSAAEMNGNRVNVLFSDAAGDQWCDLSYTIETSPDDVTVANIATAVWAKLTATMTDAGTIGKLLVDLYALGDTEWAAIKAKTDLLPAEPAGAGSAMTLTSGERDAVAAALLDMANGVESGLTVRGSLRLALAALAGKASGMATSTGVFRNAVADSKPRITATQDADGNRSAITYDAS